VLEADPKYVGGISRTVVYRGYRFDIGGHRFFSKSEQVEDLWKEILPNDFLERPRSSRIYYDGKYFTYPLKPIEALLNLGPLEAAACVASYAKARMKPHPHPDNFEDWVVNQFGQRLYRIFFKTYTEKVWGMSCREISADWAQQRIKGLSLSGAILNALGAGAKPGKGGAVVKTLIDHYRYPRLGPGMMWEACAERITGFGGSLRLGRKMTEMKPSGDSVLVRHRGSEGDEQELQVDHVISSAPLGKLGQALCPRLSDASLGAARALKYRDFLIVVLIAEDLGRFTDNWVYIQDSGVRVGRVQNFKSWSPDMVPVPNMGAYGCEYFCHAGDDLWNRSDQELVDLARSELDSICLLPAHTVKDACVVRQKKAYPVYDADYARHVTTVRHELEERYPWLQVVGRNGMHKYNNQDHSMMTAMLAVENILNDERRYDLWKVNQDAEYHEQEVTEANRGGRAVPRRVSG